MHACMYVCMDVCMYACKYICIHACMYVCVYMYVCMYISIYTCIMLYITVYIRYSWSPVRYPSSMAMRYMVEKRISRYQYQNFAKTCIVFIGTGTLSLQ